MGEGGGGGERDTELFWWGCCSNMNERETFKLSFIGCKSLFVPVLFMEFLAGVIYLKMYFCNFTGILFVLLSLNGLNTRDLQNCNNLNCFYLNLFEKSTSHFNNIIIFMISNTENNSNYN